MESQAFEKSLADHCSVLLTEGIVLLRLQSTYYQTDSHQEALTRLSKKVGPFNHPDFIAEARELEQQIKSKAHPPAKRDKLYERFLKLNFKNTLKSLENQKLTGTYAKAYADSALSDLSAYAVSQEAIAAAEKSILAWFQSVKAMLDKLDELPEDRRSELLMDTSRESFEKRALVGSLRLSELRFWRLLMTPVNDE